MATYVEGAVELVADFGRISGKAFPVVAASAFKGAKNLSDALNGNLADSKHFKGAAGSVDFDDRTTFGAVLFEVGPNKGRRGGALANVAFFGTSRGGGTVDLDGPVKAEEGALVKYVSEAIGGLL